MRDMTITGQDTYMTRTKQDTVDTRDMPRTKQDTVNMRDMTITGQDTYMTGTKQDTVNMRDMTITGQDTYMTGTSTNPQFFYFTIMRVNRTYILVHSCKHIVFCKTWCCLYFNKSRGNKTIFRFSYITSCKKTLFTHTRTYMLYENKTINK
ncbi:unnamed protein product [Mytilus edulis]|uniref:Uncharacterized protein n=1 Tax=Mytilus edulis TaxID=6550 RepID=A0A8S3QKB1_MYTED|nr:unnamed protein product [Mytilus edulis]